MGGEITTTRERLLANQIKPVETNIETPTAVESVTPKADPIQVPQVDGLSRMAQFNQQQLAKSEEEQAKADKRKRSQDIILGIGDSLGSMANLYYTTKGAPSQRQSSLYAANDARYQQAQADRDKNFDALKSRMEELNNAAYSRDREDAQIEREDARFKLQLDNSNKQYEDAKAIRERERAEDAAYKEQVRQDNLAKDAEVAERQNRQFNATLALNQEKADTAAATASTKAINSNKFISTYAPDGKVTPTQVGNTVYNVPVKYLEGIKGALVSAIKQDAAQEDTSKMTQLDKLKRDEAYKKLDSYNISAILDFARNSSSAQSYLRDAEQMFQNDYNQALGRPIQDKLMDNEENKEVDWDNEYENK